MLIFNCGIEKANDTQKNNMKTYRVLDRENLAKDPPQVFS